MNFLLKQSAVQIKNDGILRRARACKHTQKLAELKPDECILIKVSNFRLLRRTKGVSFSSAVLLLLEGLGDRLSSGFRPAVYGTRNYVLTTSFHSSRDSAVSMVTGPDDLGFEFIRQQDIYRFSKRSRRALGPTQLLYDYRGLSPWVKLPRHEADHSPPCSSEVKKWTKCRPITPFPYMHSWCVYGQNYLFYRLLPYSSKFTINF
jgi:hypothetical protein